MPSPYPVPTSPPETPADGGASILAPIMQAGGGLMAINAAALLVGGLSSGPADPLLAGDGPDASSAWIAILALSLVRSVVHAVAGYRAGGAGLSVGPLLAYAWTGIALSIPVALLARAEFALDGRITAALAAGLAAWPMVVLLVARGRLIGPGPWRPSPPRDRGLVGLGLLQQALLFAALPLWLSATAGWYSTAGGRAALGPAVLAVAAFYLVRIGFGFAFGRALAGLNPRAIARAGRRYRASARAALVLAFGCWLYLVSAGGGVPFQLHGLLALLGLHLWSEVIVSRVVRAQPAADGPDPTFARDAGLATAGVLLLAAGAFDLVSELGAIWAGEPGTGQSRLPGELELWFTASWNGLAGSAVMLAAAVALIRLPDRFRWPALLFVAVEVAEIVYGGWVLVEDLTGPDPLPWELVLASIGLTTQTLGLSAMFVALVLGGLWYAAHRPSPAPNAELARTFE